jgi:hypothetical protein
MPAGAQSVTVTEETADGPLAAPTVIRQPVVIARWASIVDSLPVDTAYQSNGVTSCPAMTAVTVTDVRLDVSYASLPTVSLDESVFCPLGSSPRQARTPATPC